MRRIGETASRVGLGAVLVLGVTACGGESNDTAKTEPTIEWYKARFASMEDELGAVSEALVTGEERYEQYIQALPEDCQSAIQSFIPPAGGLWEEVSDEDAVIATAPDCQPSHLYAVPELRGQYDQLLILRGDEANLNHWMGATAAKVLEMSEQPATTTVTLK